MSETAVSRVERRREQNRVSARRHYYKSLSHVQKLQAQVQALEKELDFCKFHAEAAAPIIGTAVRRLQKLQDARDDLKRENSLLCKRKDEYLKWELALHQQVDRYLQAAEPVQTSTKGADRGAPDRPQICRRWMLIEPLTLEDCQDMTRSVYAEIKAFQESASSIPPNTSVLGWAHKSQVVNGQVKFSLQKVFPNRTAFELMQQSWAILSSSQMTGLFSEKMNMRYELVQQIDSSNVVQYLESELHGINPSTGEATLTIRRILAFQSMFETESGYIAIFLSLDPHRLAKWPETCDPIPPGANVHYETTPGFTWTSYEFAGPTGEDCKNSYVGSIRSEANYASWAIEVLLMVLRWEGIAVGPTFTLLNQSDEEDKVAVE